MLSRRAAGPRSEWEVRMTGSHDRTPIAVVDFFRDYRHELGSTVAAAVTVPGVTRGDGYTVESRDHRGERIVLSGAPGGRHCSSGDADPRPGGFAAEVGRVVLTHEFVLDAANGGRKDVAGTGDPGPVT
jgi:hypothetical protein